MPSAVFLFMYSKVRHTAEAVMRFRLENKVHTPRQIPHNEFLIRISEDPLKPNLRRCCCRSIICLGINDAGRCCLIKQQLSSHCCCGGFKSPYIFHKHWAFGHFSSYGKSKKNTNESSVGTDFLIWKISTSHHRFTLALLKISLSLTVNILLWCVQTYCGDVVVFGSFIDFLYLSAQLPLAFVINCKQEEGLR